MSILTRARAAIIFMGFHPIPRKERCPLTRSDRQALAAGFVCYSEFPFSLLRKTIENQGQLCQTSLLALTT